jgi:hypothetical protein
MMQKEPKSEKNMYQPPERLHAGWSGRWMLGLGGQIIGGRDNAIVRYVCFGMAIGLSGSGAVKGCRSCQSGVISGGERAQRVPDQAKVAGERWNQ